MNRDYSLEKWYQHQDSEIQQLSRKIGISFSRGYWVKGEDGRFGTITGARGDCLMIKFEGDTCTTKCRPSKLKKIYGSRCRPLK